MNPEDYVSYPLALALKKHGFDEPCRHHYDIEDAPDGCYWEGCSLHKKNHNEDVPKFSAPTLWQAQKWLREVHSLHVDISTHGKNYWTTSITGFNDEDIPVGYLHPVNAQAFDNYESALSAGIAATLELIEENKCNPSPDSTHSC